MATPEPPTAPTTTEHESLRALYNTYITHCNAHNLAGMESFYSTPTININDIPTPSSGVTDQFVPLITAFPDWHWEIRNLSIDGEFLALHLRVTGTHLGTFEGIEATGRKVDAMEFTLYRVVGGKFVSVWDLVDWEGVRGQLLRGKE